MDWVSPTLGMLFDWPRSDVKRMQAYYNIDLRCPSNPMTFTDAAFGATIADPRAYTYANYSAVVRFHTHPSSEGTSALGTRA